MQIFPASFSVSHIAKCLLLSAPSIDAKRMNLTNYHAKYFAHELTKRCPSDSVSKLAASLADAQVDLNPHQIDAALFAFRSPLSRARFSQMKLDSAKPSRRDWSFRRNGRSAGGAFSSSFRQISESSGTKN